MRSNFTFIIAVLILTACSQTPTSVTSTLLPSTTPTNISTVTPTVLPAFTSTSQVVEQPPDLAPEIVTAAQEFFGPGFEIRADGSVLDKATGLDIPGLEVILSADGTSWEMGRTHEYEGDPNFYQPITKESVKLLPDGTLDFNCWRYTPEGEWIRESYSTADGVNIKGKGEHLYTAAEMQVFFTNPANVDMNVKEYNYKVLKRPFLRNGGGGHPGFEYNGVKEYLNEWGWADNIVPLADGKGGYKVVDTGVFEVGETLNNQVTIYYFMGPDGKADVRFGEGGEFVADGNDPNHTQKNEHPIAWSEYYRDHKPKW